MIVIFNALCVLCGALALNREDFHVVVSNSTKVRDNIGRGLDMIRHIGSSPGAHKARQSEEFLQKLIRATLRNEESVSTPCSE